MKSHLLQLNFLYLLCDTLQSEFLAFFFFFTSFSLSTTLELGASLIAQLVKNLPMMQETPAQFLGWEDPLEKG